MIEILIVSAPFTAVGALMFVPAMLGIILKDEKLKKTFRF